MLEEADLKDNFEEQQRKDQVNTRARVNQESFQNEVEADRYAEYVAMGWREPEPQDLEKVVFNRNFRRSEANLIKACKILRDSYLSRHGRDNNGVENANIYFNQAMKTRPEAASEALLKEILKGAGAIDTGATQAHSSYDEKLD